MKSVEIANIAIQLLILLTVVVTVIVYYRQLKAMQAQLQAALESSARAFHNDLVRLSISDQDILEVWRKSHGDLPPEDFKRHLFVNLHLSHLETLFQLHRLNLDQIAAEMAHHSMNPYYRSFWARARGHRARMTGAAGDKSNEFHALCEKVFGGSAGIEAGTANSTSS